jgi:hypothetical protein
MAQRSGAYRARHPWSRESGTLRFSEGIKWLAPLFLLIWSIAPGKKSALPAVRFSIPMTARQLEEPLPLMFVQRTNLRPCLDPNGNMMAL